MPKPTAVDFDLRRPFARADAIAAGVSPALLRGPSYRQIYRGVHIDASVPENPLIRVQASLLIHPPTAFASHTSAARVYKLPIPDFADEHVSVFAEKDRRRRPGIRNHVVGPETPVKRVRGVRVSAPARTFVELAGVLDLVELVVVGDALVRLKWITPEQLRTFCAKSNHPRARAAARAAEFVRDGTDSPMESRLRMLIVLAGLPEPDVNHTVFWPDGSVRYRFDLSYPDLKLIIEYDGRQHRDDLAQWDADTLRKDWFDHNGWMHVPVFSWGIYRQPDLTLQRVCAALKSRGCTDLPRRLSDEWRPFFPVRGRS